MIDLHCHSTYSDGTDTPAEIVHRAVSGDLFSVALTDHDTVDGVAPFLAEARGAAIHAIPGVEISCQGNEGGVHIVGLFVNHEDRHLRTLLHSICEARNDRNQRIRARLAQLGHPVDASDLKRFCSGDVLGRPHFARALMEGGHCRTMKEAFDLFLGRGKPAYVPRQVPSYAQGITAIHDAGGVAIWAHPMGRNRRISSIEDTAHRLREFGIDGLETRYLEYTQQRDREASRIATELGLLESGGSDYHGENIVGVNLGTGYGKLAVPDAFVAPLEERARSYGWRGSAH
ncbi:MAG: PHP domain-containing protein [Lentisphaeria bacterium]|nr:PHP domain-containing protein [Lentisphaeria bacterium]